MGKQSGFSVEVITLPHKPLMDNSGSTQMCCRNHWRQVHKAAPKYHPKPSLEAPRQPSSKKAVYPQPLHEETLPPCLTQKRQRKL